MTTGRTTTSRCYLNETITAAEWRPRSFVAQPSLVRGLSVCKLTIWGFGCVFCREMPKESGGLNETGFREKREG